MAQASQVISQAGQQKSASALPEVAMPGLGTAEVQQRISSGQTNALKKRHRAQYGRSSVPTFSPFSMR